MSTSQPPRIEIAQPATGEDEWRALREPIMSGWLTQGPKVAEFERAFAARHGVKHAVATTSCTTALHLSLVALGIGPGDEVVVPAFTWIATANVVLYCGATPVFVDVDRTTFNLSPEQLARSVSDRTRAIIPVHLFGLCADMDAIAAVAGDIPLVEDAACAAGAAYKKRPAGSIGHVGCFSFHPRKSITTGEGGMLTTNDDQLAATLVMLRNHGASVPEEVRHHGPRPHILPDFNLLGFNYRMTDLQGAVGLVQLQKLDRLRDERQRQAEFYARELADLAWLRTPEVPADGTHGWQAFVCYVDESRNRNELMNALHDAGISVRPGTHAVHHQNLYRHRFGIDPAAFPNALACERQTLAIPLHNRLTNNDLARIVDCLKSA